MYKFQSIFLLGGTLVCLTATTAIAKPSHSRETSVSTQAADLLTSSNHSTNYQLAGVPLDLDKFCQNYPYNSRCADRPVPDATEAEIEIKPSPTEDYKTSSSNNQTKQGWGIASEISTLGLGGECGTQNHSSIQCASWY